MEIDDLTPIIHSVTERGRILSPVDPSVPEATRAVIAAEARLQAELDAVHGAQYGTNDVVEATGVNLPVLNGWLAQGDFNLAKQNPGRGKSRSYSANDIARIRLVRQLVDFSFPLRSAFQITAALQAFWDINPAHGGVFEEKEGCMRIWLTIVAKTHWDRLPLDVLRSLDYGGPIEAEGYVAKLIADNPRSSKGRLEHVLIALRDAAVIVINLDALKADTVGKLKGKLPRNG